MSFARNSLDRPSIEARCIGVGDGGGQGSTCPSKIRGKYFSGNYYVKFGNFRAKIMLISGFLLNFQANIIKKLGILSYFRAKNMQNSGVLFIF